MRTLKLFLAIMLMSVVSLEASGINIPDTLDYNIVYHWGFIEKVAGHGSVTFKVDGDTLSGTLVGKSIPWDGRVYCLNDTLRTVIHNNDGIITAHRLYANGCYTKPLVADSTAVGLMDNPANYCMTDGRGTLDADPSTMEAVAITTDMIGFMYMTRIIDFSTMSPADNVTIPIKCPDGTEKQLSVTYVTSAPYNDQGMAWQVTFNYTYKGEMSSYPVTCYVSQTTRLPLEISADLRIGRMEMVYAPKTN